MKRFILFLIIVVLAVFGLQRWNEERRSGRRVPEKYTPATGATLNAGDVQSLAAIDREYTKLVDAVVPSVVSILTSRKMQAPNILIDPFEQFFGMQRRFRRGAPREFVQNALGSGVIVSKEGHVL